MENIYNKLHTFNQNLIRYFTYQMKGKINIDVTQIEHGDFILELLKILTNNGLEQLLYKYATWNMSV